MTAETINRSDLDLLLGVAAEGGEIAMRYFGEANRVWHKDGNSPVSEADFAVDRHLRERLLKARPDYGWLSEESEDTAGRQEAGRLFVVDPIDGTRGFLDGRTEWCISVAVVENGRPVAGVLACPALCETYCAIRGGGAMLNAGPLPQLGAGAIGSITASKKLNALLGAPSGPALTVLPFVPSLAYRIAMVACGRVDAAFARAGASDWDIAAADVILAEAGGCMTGLSGDAMAYNRKSTRRGALLATGRERLPDLIALAKQGGFLH